VSAESPAQVSAAQLQQEVATAEEAIDRAQPSPASARLTQTRSFLARCAKTRGWAYSASMTAPRVTPLLRTGSHREASNIFTIPDLT
jgi:hypothetical protein